MTGINGGAGLSAVPIGPGVAILDPFVADASKLIAADPVPEPATAMLVLLGALAIPAFVGRRA
jgi:hypothetical protein